MPKVVVTNVENLGGNPNSAALAINENTQRLADAIENTLSRDGTGPNQMEDLLDMNGFRIINLGAPIAPDDAVRLRDITGAISDVDGLVPSGGTDGQVLTKQSGTDFDYEWEDIPFPDLGPDTIPQSWVINLVGDLVLLAAGITSLSGAKADKTITITAGSGLTGGGDLSANRTLNVGAGTGITVNADDVALSAATQTSLGKADAAVQPARAVNTGTGLSGGGDLSADRTISLANTAVTAASYTNANITIDAQGRITAASSGSTAGQAADIQVFTSSGTWNKPTGAKTVEVICIGGGGGGGSGRKGAVGSTRASASAGAGAGTSRAIMPASALGSSETVTVGTGGTGGAAVTVNSTNGNNGAAGGDSSFGAHLRARGGAAGLGSGTASAASVAGGEGLISDGGASGGGGSTVAGSATKFGGGGGGSGGGVNNTNTDNNGGAGAGGPTMRGTPLTAGTAGTGSGTGGTDGGTGASGAADWQAGSGGGGGGSSSSATGGVQSGAGGAGGLYGGGGGAGGSSTDGSGGSKAGGAGAAGVVVVVTYF